jgi:hypothetical protein
VTKIPDRNNLKKEGLILAHAFMGFSSRSPNSTDSGPMVRQSIMVAGAYGTELFNS